MSKETQLVNTKSIQDTLNKFSLLARAFLYFFVRGNATKKVVDPKTIVVVQPAQIGDMICTTPVFRAIKDRYPKARLIVVGKGINKETLAGNPDVDGYIAWTEDIMKIVPELAKENADFGCVTSPNFFGLALLYLSGVRTIAAPLIKNGWSPYETRPYKLLRALVIQKEHVMRRYVPREYLKLLEPLGIHTDVTKKYCYSTDAAKAKMRALVAPLKASHKTVVGVLSGAGNWIKQWPCDRLGQVSDYLIDKYHVGIVVIGGQSEVERSAELIANIKGRAHVLDTTNTLSIDEAKALVGDLDVLLGVDTGPQFFAEAQDIPTIDIACNIDVNEQAPNDGKTHLVVEPKRRDGDTPVLTMNARMIDYDEAKRQIDSLTVADVIEKVDELFVRLGR
jgi:ADP-heptose:LPS heptosyltransferase